MSTADDPRQTAPRLLGWFAGTGAVTVAFSGGVDSALVVAAAARALEPSAVVAATAVSPALPDGTLTAAARFAASLGVAHRLVPTHEMDVEGYRRNDHDRCYFCKSTLVDTVSALQSPGAVLLTGTNADDLVAGFRPGIRAAAERGARTPLADVGLTKSGVRALARAWSLPVWDRPASPCLSSRIAYGIAITPLRLARVDRAEQAVRGVLRDAGLSSVDLRVRDLGESARVEVDGSVVDDVRRTAVVEAVRDAGFSGPVGVESFASGGLNALPARQWTT